MSERWSIISFKFVWVIQDIGNQIQVSRNEVSGYYLSSKSDSAREAQEVSYPEASGQIDFLRVEIRQ
jgi:hypothetical protein